jgi:NADP-dependent 3-hydroxy acid dehydrogenase YdfG
MWCERASKSTFRTAEKLMNHPVSLIINNAGVGLGGKFDEVSLEDWQWCMHVNLWGLFMVVIILFLSLSNKVMGQLSMLLQLRVIQQLPK